MINGHGNDQYRYKNNIVADFSSNIVYSGLSTKLKEHLATKIGTIDIYPEPDAGELRKKIAAHHNISEDSIVVTNGSTEAFYLLAHMFKNKSSSIFIPSFSEYEDACKLYGNSVNYIPNNSIYSSKIPNEGVVWFGNPNNPDGKVVTNEYISEQCKMNPDAIFVIDEAYAELCYGFTSCVKLIKDFPNLIVVRSLTKAFAIPGLRLGYTVMNTDIQEKVSALKMPWSVNSLAIEAGNYIMDNYPALLPDIKKMSQITDSFRNELKSIEGIEVIDSPCNFFLVRLKNGSVEELKDFLVKEYGLLIRDASNFRGLNNSYLRLAVQENKYNLLLSEGIRKWFIQGS